MIEQPRSTGSEKAQAIRDFLATYDGRTAVRQVASWIRGRLHSELYRREREHYAEWIDHGGES